MAFFVAMYINTLYTGVSSVQGLYMRGKLNRVRMILKCVCKDSKIKVVITFFRALWVILVTGYAGGYTKWLCNFIKVVMQKRVLRGYDTRG